MTKERSVLKDFHALMKNIARFSDGQAAVTTWEEDNIGDFEVTLSPNDGLYKDGEFVFRIDTGSDYPSCPPVVHCKTAIFHPNIDTIDDSEGEICLNLFDSDVWSGECTLEDVVQGLLFLLYNPNLDDPLCAQCAGGTEEDFARNVRISLAGGVVEDTYIYPVNPGYARKHPEARVCVQDEKAVGDGDDPVLVKENCDDGLDDEGRGDRLQEEPKAELQDSKKESSRTEGDDAGKGIIYIEAFVQKEDTDIVDCNFGIRQIISCSITEDEEDLEEEEVEELEDAGSVSSEEKEDDNHDPTLTDIHTEYNSDVSDEEFELVLDTLDRVESCRCQEGSETTLSWSNIIYGSNCRNCPGAKSLSDLDRSVDDPASTSASVGSRASRTPTVLSRFYHALQTRSFRRFLL